MANILVVDDELGIRDLLQEILNDEGHTVEVAENAAQARAARLRDRPDLVLLDIWMPDTIDTAVEATKIGALAFLEKPITMQKLLKAVEQGLARTVVRKLQTPSSQAVTVVVESAEVESSSPEGILHADLGPMARQSFGLDKPLREARDEFEKAYFEYHLAKENGSMTRVAEKTGLERTHLYRKLKQLGVDLTRGKRNGNPGLMGL